MFLEGNWGRSKDLKENVNQKHIVPDGAFLEEDREPPTAADRAQQFAKLHKRDPQRY